MSNQNYRVIANSFGIDANKYDQNSTIQKKSGYYLLSNLPRKNFNVSVDLGCGSGFFISQLEQLSTKVLALDLSVGMLDFVKQKYVNSEQKVFNFDLDDFSFLKSNVELIFSNFALQWSSNISNVIHSMSQNIIPGCTLALAFPVDGTLKELVEAFQQIGEPYFINNFPIVEEIEKVLKNENLKIELFNVAEEKVVFDSFLSALHSITDIGAGVNLKSSNHKLTIRTVKLLKNYFAQKGFVDFSTCYNICYIIASK